MARATQPAPRLHQVQGRVTAWYVWVPGAEGMWAELRRAHAARSEMAHLASNLQAYLMCEVLERAWAAFTQRLAAVTDLDGLIGAPCRDPLRGGCTGALGRPRCALSAVLEDLKDITG